MIKCTMEQVCLWMAPFKRLPTPTMRSAAGSKIVTCHPPVAESPPNRRRFTKTPPRPPSKKARRIAA